MCDQVEIGRCGADNPNALKQARERVATRQGARAVNPLFFPRSDLCAAKKCRILTNHQPGRFDVTTHRATRVELAVFSHENIALHRPSHLHRFRPDLTAYARVLPDRKRSGGIDCALHLAVDEQLVQEFDRAFDRNSSGKRRAPDCVGMNVRLDDPGTTDGLADWFAAAAGSVFRVNMCIP